MSKDLLHQIDWNKDHPDDKLINTPKEPQYAILHYACGNGWQLVHSGVSLNEAREIKKRYQSTSQQVKIILEVE